MSNLLRGIIPLTPLLLVGFPYEGYGQAGGCKLASISEPADHDVQPCFGLNYSGSWGNSTTENFEPVLGIRYQTDALVLRGVLEYGFESTRDSTLRNRVDGQVDLLTGALGFPVGDVRLNPLLTARVVRDELKRDESYTAVGLGVGTWVHLEPGGSLFVSLQPSVEREDFTGLEAVDRPVWRAALDGHLRFPNNTKLNLSLGYSFANFASPIRDFRLETQLGLEIETRIPGLRFAPTFVFRRDSEPPDGTEDNDYELKIGLGYIKKPADTKTRYVFEALTLFEAPTDEARRLRELPVGTEVVLSSCRRDWCWIRISPKSLRNFLDEGPHQGFVRSRLTTEPP